MSHSLQAASFKIMYLLPETAYYSLFMENYSISKRGWSAGALVLGQLPVPGRPTIWRIVGKGPIALTVGAGGGV